MRGAALIAAALLAAGAAGLWALSAPDPVPGDPFAGLAPDLDEGRRVFLAAGCAACHAAPGATGEARLVLSGGEAFATAFGTFYAPNISPSREGIGGWSAKDLMNALTRGVRRDGAHLYPALPYASYRLMTAGDALSLYAYLRTLPPSEVASRPHEVGFPFSVRRGLGLWKRLFLSADYVMADAADPEVARGRYLVEVLGHCGECHTPRGALGQLDRTRWLGGAPNPAGRGTVPALTPDKLRWSADDIAYYLATGITPEYETVGGAMVDVVENWAQMTEEDRKAVAAYLKAVR